VEQMQRSMKQQNIKPGVHMHVQLPLQPRHLMWR
jgi:hypothetical protein